MIIRLILKLAQSAVVRLLGEQEPNSGEALELIILNPSMKMDRWLK
jgi:hypothetical protein